MNTTVNALVTIATGVLGVAILALLVSKKANTAGVIGAGGSAFSNALGVALSPVTGAGNMIGNGNGILGY